MLAPPLRCCKQSPGMAEPCLWHCCPPRPGSTSVSSEEGPPKKQRKPRSEKRAARQAARAAKQSGAGNAEEALRIRGLLGLVPEGPTPAAPAAGAAAPAVVADATPAGFRVSDLFAAGTAQAAAEPADSSEDDGEAEGPGSAPAAQTPGRFSFNFAMAAGKEEPAGQAGCSDSEPAEQQQQQLPPKPGGGSSKPDGGSAARQGSTAAEAEAKDFVPRRVFVGGMPFHYEVSFRSAQLLLSSRLQPGPWQGTQKTEACLIMMACWPPIQAQNLNAPHFDARIHGMSPCLLSGLHDASAGDAHFMLG